MPSCLLLLAFFFLSYDTITDQRTRMALFINASMFMEFFLRFCFGRALPLEFLSAAAT